MIQTRIVYVCDSCKKEMRRNEIGGSLRACDSRGRFQCDGILHLCTGCRRAIENTFFHGEQLLGIDMTYHYEELNSSLKKRDGYSG